MTASPGLFAKYPNPIFIETGTFLGDGVQHALDAAFPRVVSIELDPIHFANARARFRTVPADRLWLLHGPSEDRLPDALARFPGPFTFWLDAHYSGPGTARGDHFAPLLAELAAIARHPAAGDSTFLIDDRRCLGTAEMDHLTEPALRAALARINPDVIFRLEPGHQPDDILVAAPPRQHPSA